jgi:hypothetical protein
MSGMSCAKQMVNHSFLFSKAPFSSANSLVITAIVRKRAVSHRFKT